MALKEFTEQYIGKKINSNIQSTGLADSMRPGTLSFLENIQFIEDIKRNENIVAVFVREKDAGWLPDDIEAVVVESPKSEFFDVHNAYYKHHLHYKVNSIASSAVIHPSAVIADNGVVIGENTIIGAHTTILGGVEIGNNTMIGPNCVIGYDGFHVYTDMDGIKRVVIHDGKVIIGNNVDIQAAVTIDKGLMGRDTLIKDECKIDNAVHIAHRSHIGSQTLIASGACVAGSVDVGRDVWIGPHAVIANRISICDNARVLIGSVVIRNIKRPINVSGNFAVEHIKHLKSQC